MERKKRTFRRRSPAPSIIRFDTAIYLFLLAVMVMAGACAPKPPPQPSVFGPYDGIASWYGDDFHGKKTSSGERYNMYKLTAASKTLPLGTKVEVTRLDNQKSVAVRINDRGPFVEGRIIDLSYGAAWRLDMIEDGLAPVRVTVLSLPAGTRPASESGAGSLPGIDYWVQVGSFTRLENAAWLKKRLEPDFTGVLVKTSNSEGTTLHRVLIGPFGSRGEAQAILVRLDESGLKGFVKEGPGSY